MYSELNRVRGIYAVFGGIYALFAGAIVLFVMIASMFMTEVSMPTVLSTLFFVLNAVLLLRLPVHQWVRTLTRQRALTIGAAIHLIGFAVMSTGATEVDRVMILFFGIVPAAFAVSSVVRHEATCPKLIRRDRR